MMCHRSTRLSSLSLYIEGGTKVYHWLPSDIRRQRMGDLTVALVRRTGE